MAGLLATSRGIKKVYNRKPIYSICPIAAVKKLYKRPASIMKNLDRSIFALSLCTKAFPEIWLVEKP